MPRSDKYSVLFTGESRETVLHVHLAYELLLLPEAIKDYSRRTRGWQEAVNLRYMEINGSRSFSRQLPK
jgi:hypothetical protein